MGQRSCERAKKAIRTPAQICPVARGDRNECYFPPSHGVGKNQQGPHSNGLLLFHQHEVDRLAVASNPRQPTTRLPLGRLWPNTSLANQLALGTWWPTTPLRLQMDQKAQGARSFNRIAQTATQNRSADHSAGLFESHSIAPRRSRILP